MTRRLRLLVAVARPAVLVLLALYAATGAARGGSPDDRGLLLAVLVPVAAFLLCSVLLNDLADEAVDRVNLAGDPRRPLVTGAARRRELRIAAGVAAVLAPAAAVPLGPGCVLVVLAGLATSAAYSLPPARLAARGAVASLVLPACYVAVPYLLGLLAAAGTVRPADLVLLAGLYIGFVGRILLKDFRDVRGDALFGKRTFLVRHGRRATCAFAAACWMLGGVLLVLGAGGPRPALVAATGLGTAAALVLLRALATDGGHRRDERLISATAIVGRGMLLVLLAHLSVPAGWPAPAYDAVVAAIALVLGGQAWEMARHGPRARGTVPAGWAATDGGRPATDGAGGTEPAVAGTGRP